MQHNAEEPGSRTPAPGDLRIVQLFLNTRDIEGVTEELDSPRSLQRWLGRVSLPGADREPAPGDLERVIAFREALRDLVWANNAHVLEWRTVDLLNRAGEHSRLAVQFNARGQAELVPTTTGVDGAITRLLAIVERATADGTWIRLKACGNPDCRWVFYDRSKNHAGTWCTMSICGNVMKARAYRKRRGQG